MRDVALVVLCVIGLTASLSGAVGVLRMPDLYTRIQCATKNITLGALPVLVALVVAGGLVSQYASRALLVAFLLCVVNPAASHALSRAAYKVGVPQWRGAVADEVRERRSGTARDSSGGGG